MKSKTIASDLYRINSTFSVCFTFNDGIIDCTWFPHVPTGRDYRRVLDKYRNVRNGFISDVSKRTGQNITCVEVQR